MASDLDHPYCPTCQRRMVYVCLVIGGYIFQTWQCDCVYRDEPEYAPPEIVADICRSREWDDGSIVYDVEVILEGENGETQAPPDAN